MKYEDNIKELEKIVEKLSTGKLSVDEGLALYQKGIELARESMNELNGAKGKIEMLNKELESLEAETEIESDEDDDE